MLYHRNGIAGAGRRFNPPADSAGALLLFAHLNQAKATRLLRVAEKVIAGRALSPLEIALARAELIRLRPSAAIVEAFDRTVGG